MEKVALPLVDAISVPWAEVGVDPSTVQRICAPAVVVDIVTVFLRTGKVPPDGEKAGSTTWLALVEYAPDAIRESEPLRSALNAMAFKI